MGRDTKLPRRLLLVALVSAAPAVAATQDDAYPTRALRAIVPFPPGSATDSVARFLAERLSPRLGQPVVVENVPGGNGLIAARQAARAAPDGHSFFFATNSTHAASVHLVKEPGYDPVRGFLPDAAARCASYAGWMMCRAHQSRTL